MRSIVVSRHVVWDTAGFAAAASGESRIARDRYRASGGVSLHNGPETRIQEEPYFWGAPHRMIVALMEYPPYTFSPKLVKSLTPVCEIAATVS
jgi:hypothetical protein